MSVNLALLAPSIAAFVAGGGLYLFAKRIHSKSLAEPETASIPKQVPAAPAKEGARGPFDITGSSRAAENRLLHVLFGREGKKRSRRRSTGEITTQVSEEPESEPKARMFEVGKP